MKLSTLKNRVKNKWILAEVLKEDKLNQPTDVKLVIASKDKDKIYDKWAEMPKDKIFAALYTGEIKGNFIFPHVIASI